LITLDKNLKIIAKDRNSIEGESILQLQNTMKLKGMVKGVGHPDLHPGKGHPVGASFLSEGCFYPYLVGNDIGCGVAVYQTDMKARKFHISKIEKKLVDMEGSYNENISDELSKHRLLPLKFRDSLGTIGSGNHFAEFQTVSKVFNKEEMAKYGLDKQNVFFLAHSGSRGLGQSILENHIMKFNSEGLDYPSEDAKEYLEKHDYAVRWAECNRELIARRFLNKVKADYEKVLDLTHNQVVKIDEDKFLHRKGAAPLKSIMVVPGSRGTLTYLLKLVHDCESEFLWSIAHGAGRKWKRGECKSRLSGKYSVKDMKKTRLGGHVICEDKDLLYEEAPEAYKSIDAVIQVLVDHGIAEIIATLKPIVTYKKRKIQY
jgi:release factor H-coupled RctB family protein